MGNGAPPAAGGGLPGANAGAANAPAGPPGAAPACDWEIYVKTHSQHRFRPTPAFDTQLLTNDGAVALTQSTTMTAKDSTDAKFTGSGLKSYFATNTAPKIAKEADWMLVTGPYSQTPLFGQKTNVQVSNGQVGASAPHVDLYIRH